MEDGLKEQISKHVLDNEAGIRKAHLLKDKELEAVKQQRIYEQELYEKFKGIVEGQQYFRYQHVLDLGIDFDILIHLSAKNTGKTTELYRLINKCLERGEKFCYGRVTAQELKTEINKFDTDEKSPVQIIGFKGQYYFFKKTDIEEFLEANPTKVNIRFTDLKKAGLDYCGLAMTFMGSNTLGSGNYENFTTIFFDEIVSYTPKNYVNDLVLSNWGAAVSTITRNKKKLTIIMMGNLRPHMTSIPILEYYNIDIADNLRVIKRQMDDNKPCTILYINSGALYSNALKNQASVTHHGSLEDRLFLEHNKLINTSSKVLTEEIVDKMESILAIAVTYKDSQYVLELKRTSWPDFKDNGLMETKHIYALALHPLKITTSLKTRITTWDWEISHMFSFVKHIKNNYSRFRHIVKIFSMHNLYYNNAKSLELGSAIIHYYKNKLFKDEWQRK